jgi:phosphate starvation-inducible PhoH-like protein
MGRARRSDHNIRAENREARKSRQPKASNQKSGYGAVVPFRGNNIKPVNPLNEKQRLLIASIIANTLTFATGCAGTGKSFLAVGTALKMLLNREIEQIVITKPDFEIDSKLGTLPGDQNEKTAPLFRSIRDIMYKLIGSGFMEVLEKSGKIKFETLGNILGTTFDNSVMIMDEAQNCTPNQMKAFVTRIGKNSKIIICGDYKEQTFIEGRNGLKDAVRRFHGEPSVSRVDFEIDDIVRDDFVKVAILAYRKNLDGPDEPIEDE